MAKRRRERLMPKEEQVRRLATYLSNRGVHFSKEDLRDYVDSTLHYDENKHDVLKHYQAKQEKRIGDKDFIIDQARSLHASRTIRAQVMDYNKRAKRLFTPEQLARSEQRVDLWFTHPNRFDIMGIDYGKRKLVMPKGSELPKMRGKPQKVTEKTLLERLQELPF